MLQPVHTASDRTAGAFGSAVTGSAFFPGQFNGRTALASVLALAEVHGVAARSVAELAVSMGVGLPTKLGVHDLMRAADILGLDVQLSQLSPNDLAHVPLPALLLNTHGGVSANLLVLSHCDSRYAVTEDHASAVPLSNMGPLSLLAEQWATDGKGWCLVVKPSPN
ncbi:MAG TPA: hypothetical protein PK347_08895 [Burkholderiaceae bacterium]|nr:hypothetical protein [Burkholderiaceae bacterium]